MLGLVMILDVNTINDWLIYLIASNIVLVILYLVSNNLKGKVRISLLNYSIMGAILAVSTSVIYAH